MFDIENGKELTQLYLKSNVILLADVFEKFAKVSTTEYGINPLYCVSLHVCTFHCALKNTDNKLQTLQHKHLVSALGNNIRGSLGSVLGDRCVESEDNKKILYMDANIFFAQSMSQVLTYDENEMWHCHPEFFYEQIRRNSYSPVIQILVISLKWIKNTRMK